MALLFLKGEKGMRKENVLTIVSVVGSMVAGFVGAYAAFRYAKKNYDKSVDDYKTKLEENIKKSDRLVKDISDQVDAAVRFVYDNEAKSAFERRLKTINIEEVASAQCQKTIKGIEDSVLRKYIRDTYSAQVKSIVGDEIKNYFKDGIKKIVAEEIDSDFIRRSAKNCVKDSVEDILEDEIKRALDKIDFGKSVMSYIDDNSIKFDSNIKKEITKAVYDRLDDIAETLADDIKYEVKYDVVDILADDIKDDVIEAVKDAVDAD